MMKLTLLFMHMAFAITVYSQIPETESIKIVADSAKSIHDYQPYINVSTFSEKLNQPLYILNGKTISSDSVMLTMHRKPELIESIEILRGEKAEAYVKGRNVVIVITLKEIRKED